MDEVIPRKPRFPGRFKTFSVSEFTDREKGIDSRLLVFSQGSRAKVVEYLWLKFLWDELSKQEFRLFLTLPEVLNSEIKMNALKAILLFPKKIIRKRLNKFEKLLSLKISSKERYHGFRSRLDVEIYEIKRKLHRSPKYSGYCRTPSAVGSKRRGASGIPEALTPPDYEIKNDIVDWYHLLTVGEINLFSGRVIFHPDES